MKRIVVVVGIFFFYFIYCASSSKCAFFSLSYFREPHCFLFQLGHKKMSTYEKILILISCEFMMVFFLKLFFSAAKQREIYFAVYKNTRALRCWGRERERSHCYHHSTQPQNTSSDSTNKTKYAKKNIYIYNNNFLIHFGFLKFTLNLLSSVRSLSLCIRISFILTHVCIFSGFFNLIESEQQQQQQKKINKHKKFMLLTIIFFIFIFTECCPQQCFRCEKWKNVPLG